MIDVLDIAHGCRVVDGDIADRMRELYCLCSSPVHHVYIISHQALRTGACRFLGRRVRISMRAHSACVSCPAFRSLQELLVVISHLAAQELADAQKLLERNR